MRRALDNFEDSLFINCPYDSAYLPLLHTLLFVVLESGLEPRLAGDQVDSGQVRVEKIRDLIRTCRYSIHDLSRMEAVQAEDGPRLNMPFELGLDLGCRYFGATRFRGKQCLILERERYRYQRVLSDIAGHDIRAHGGDPKNLLTEVRNWLRVVTRRPLPSGASLWSRFNFFLLDLEDLLASHRYSEGDIQSLEVVEYIGFIQDWRTRNPGAN